MMQVLPSHCCSTALPISRCPTTTHILTSAQRQRRRTQLLGERTCAASCPCYAANTCVSSCSSSSNSGSSGMRTTLDPQILSPTVKHVACINHLHLPQTRFTRTIAPAARRSGTGYSNSDNSRSSSWQDRLYAAEGGQRDSSGTPTPQQQQQQQQQQRQGQSNVGPGGRDSRNGPSRAAQSRGKSSSRSDSRQQDAGSSSSSSSGGGGGVEAGGVSDFVVIKKAAAGSVGSYIPSTQELQVQEVELDGSRYWEAALDDFDEGEDDEDEDDEDDEGGWDDAAADDDEGGEGNNDDDIEVAEVVSLLQELAAGLEDEQSDADEEQAAGVDQQQQGSSGRVDVVWRQSYLGSQQPPLTLGPVCVKETAGKGRGVFTTSAVSAGQVLLVGSPLVLMYSQEGSTPENEELAAHLVAAATAAAASQPSGNSGGSSSKGLTPWQQHALLQLRPPGDTAADSRQRQQLPELSSLLGPPEERKEVHSSSSSSCSSSPQQVQQQQQRQQQQQQLLQPDQLPSPELLTQLVFANCTGEEFEDPCLVLLKGITSCGHLGVWPAAALINHSCAPNCHALMIGERLVVRAARDIPAATELSLSYLGPQLFAPAAVRQAELKQQWGFDCNCSRCKAEARYAASSSSSSEGSLSGLLHSVYTRAADLAPELDAAVDEDDLTRVRALQRELQELQGQVEASIRAAKPPVNVRRWLQACVYDLYDLLSLAADQVPPPPPKPSRGRGGRGGGGRGRQSGRGRSETPAVETEALASCARIVGELTPGSSAHVELATELMVRAEARFGGDHQESVDATRACAAAITTRYGPVSNSMMQLLMDTWAGAALL